MSHPVPTMKYQDQLEPVAFGSCRCGQWGQLFGKGVCANCYVMANEELLDEIEDFLESKSDVVDGSYGEPAANPAMQMLSVIKEKRP